MKILKLERGATVPLILTGIGVTLITVAAVVVTGVIISLLGWGATLLFWALLAVYIEEKFCRDFTSRIADNFTEWFRQRGWPIMQSALIVVGTIAFGALTVYFFYRFAASYAKATALLGT